MYETYGEEDPYFWLDRKLEVHVCSMPAPREDGISNCIEPIKRPHIRLLPNFEQPTEPVAERCTALEVDDDVSTGQSVNIFVAGAVLIGLIVLLTIMLFCLRNKIPLVKTIWKGDRGESEKEPEDFDPVIGMWESAQALDKMLSISQPADFSRSDHNMSVAPSDSRSCVNSQSGYDIRSYGEQCSHGIILSWELSISDNRSSDLRPNKFNSITLYIWIIASVIAFVS